MHTLTRLTLAGATIVIATGAALALVVPSIGPIMPKPSPSAKVPPTPTVPPITTFTTPTAPPAPLDDNAHPPEGPSDTCPDGSPVFRYSIVDAAAGHRYLGVQVTNCGRPETIRLEALPELGLVKANGTVGAAASIDRTNRPIAIRPGETAWFTLEWLGGGSSDDPGNRVASITFTVPGLGSGTWVGETDLGPDSAVHLHGWGATPGLALDPPR